MAAQKELQIGLRPGLRYAFGGRRRRRSEPVGTIIQKFSDTLRQGWDCSGLIGLAAGPALVIQAARCPWIGEERAALMKSNAAQSS
jgi:hypothetical protein